MSQNVTVLMPRKCCNASCLCYLTLLSTLGHGCSRFLSKWIYTDGVGHHQHLAKRSLTNYNQKIWSAQGSSTSPQDCMKMLTTSDAPGFNKSPTDMKTVDANWPKMQTSRENKT